MSTGAVALVGLGSQASLRGAAGSPMLALFMVCVLQGCSGCTLSTQLCRLRGQLLEELTAFPISF